MSGFFRSYGTHDVEGHARIQFLIDATVFVSCVHGFFTKLSTPTLYHKPKCKSLALVEPHTPRGYRRPHR